MVSLNAMLNLTGNVESMTQAQDVFGSPGEATWAVSVPGIWFRKDAISGEEKLAFGGILPDITHRIFTMPNVTITLKDRIAEVVNGNTAHYYVKRIQLSYGRLATPHHKELLVQELFE